MRWIGGISLGLLLGLTALAAAQEAPKPAAKAPDPAAGQFFEGKIRPLLAQQCYACHAGTRSQGGLKVDTAVAFFKGGDSGPLVVPGSPEKSRLIDAVSYTKDLKMPPGGKLKPQQIADLAAWVKMGAPWPNYTAAPGSGAGGAGKAGLFTDEQRKFWAFQPVRIPAVPAVKNKAWVISPVDAFILAKLEAKGVKAAPKADKRTLIRRVTFDLTGLPPTPDEVRAFLADTAPNAYAKLVDRLLASPAYGERWARHWLDVARYADSNGLDENTAFGNAWRYRDYVVKSFNDDKPYDQFVREQIAGDLLPPASDPAVNADRLAGTGFLVLGPKVLAEPDKQKMVMDIVDEQIDTVGKAFMGLTLGCARCHDHKFDPIPTKDYYSLAGIFKSTRTMQSLATVARAMERPLADQASVRQQAEYQAQLRAKQAEVRAITQRLNAAATGTVVGKLDQYLLVGRHAAVEALRDRDHPDVERPGVVTVEAEKFARGDVKVTTDGYGEGIGIIESAGRTKAFTEYELTLPAAGEYDLAVRYASGEPRPIRISLDGQRVKGDAAGKATGGFFPPQQEWHGEATVTVSAPGKHVLRVDQGTGSLPHIDKIALIPVPEPAAAAPGVQKPADLAREHGLDAESLRRSAAYLAAARARTHDRIFEPWLLLSDLPDATFAADAARLIGDWKATGKLNAWLPPVAALFAGDPPKSRDEVAQRYRQLFTPVNQAWLLLSGRPGNPATGLRDPDQEALRKALYSAFGLYMAERLYPADAAAGLKTRQAEVASLEKNPPQVSMALAVEDAKEIANVRVHIRGNTLTLGDEVPRQFLQIMAGEHQRPVPSDHSGRLELAEWLTRPDHPLTARVMVNRIWEHHFGQGIVRTPDNFGKLGERPTHPELLDYLASQFVEKGWSVKAMHRLILLSNTYQMSTAYNPETALADPDNRLYWRFNRHRLEVEEIRDSILAVAGKLDRTMGGSLLTTKNFEYVTNDQSANAAQYDSPRRAIYLPVIRNAVYDVFQVFDFVEPSFLNGQRATTTVAPQALFLLNGDFVMKQARAFADELLALPGDDTSRVRAAYLKAYGRESALDEVAAARQYLNAYAGRLTAKEPDAEKRRAAAWESYCQILFASSEFIYVE